MLITVPQHRWLWSAMDDFACHVRRHTRDELVLKVVRAGLQVEYVSSFVSLLFPLMWLSQIRAKKAVVNPMSEFKFSRWLNAGLEGVLSGCYCVSAYVSRSAVRFSSSRANADCAVCFIDFERVGE